MSPDAVQVRGSVVAVDAVTARLVTIGGITVVVTMVVVVVVVVVVASVVAMEEVVAGVEATVVVTRGGKFGVCLAMHR